VSGRVARLGPTRAPAKTTDDGAPQESTIMKTFGKLALACCVAALMTAPARAQGQGRGFGMMGGGAALLANKGVQTEIKATEDQVSKLNTFAEEMRGKQREAFQGLQDLSQEERREKMQAIQKTMAADINKGLAEILKPEQVKRFHQIQTQQAGAQAFVNSPAVADRLKLTDDQKSKIRDINMETMQAMGELRQQFQDDREGAMKKMAELRKSAMEKAVEVLTADQKATWKELTGEPYEVKFEPRPNN
jgi:Spy/CpxP family protein refolding chaperone